MTSVVVKADLVAKILTAFIFDIRPSCFSWKISYLVIPQRDALKETSILHTGWIQCEVLTTLSNPSS